MSSDFLSCGTYNSTGTPTVFYYTITPTEHANDLSLRSLPIFARPSVYYYIIKMNELWGFSEIIITLELSWGKYTCVGHVWTVDSDCISMNRYTIVQGSYRKWIKPRFGFLDTHHDGLRRLSSYPTFSPVPIGHF